ncbi:hypothetical protein CDN99_13310 [Roseateles aquatilis]|uniref:Uncharacterized protein n=1 Tax=Roseateles aquatilis TaxID=431061 RepID=A0A246JCQ3_9BURK|nr:hypothetical protein [Roseateles aquatilis]OWQ90340.1 hypothetical protein CDN99_13310 [Roseateles aquatilis]
MQTVRHHKGRTYVLDAFGQVSGPWRGRFVVKGEEDAHRGPTAWHELEDEFPSVDEAVTHADAVARQYIATFAEQA